MTTSAEPRPRDLHEEDPALAVGEAADGLTAPDPPAGEAELARATPQATAARSREVAAPDIVGLEVLQAHAIARELGLRVAATLWETKVGPWGMVLSQEPEPGAGMRTGGRIQVVVAGRPHLTVPDVRGEELAAALATLRRLGLTPVVTQARSSRTVGPGLVIGTWPSAGTVVVDGSRVSLAVSRGLIGRQGQVDGR